MEYKVVPFVAQLNLQKESTGVIAKQLEDLILAQTIGGWTYLRLESVSTYVQPITGCFGTTTKPGFMSSYQMVVFTKETDEISIHSKY